MNKLLKKLTFALTTIILAAHPLTAWAAEPVRITITASQNSESESQLNAILNVTNSKELTNGKLRIRYDSDTLKLSSVKAGDVLSGSMNEINDCLTGNKEEGEIVLVFATADPLQKEGSLLDLTFQITEGAKVEDALLNITADPEKMAGDSGDIQTESIPLQSRISELISSNGNTADTPNNKNNNGSKEDNLSSKNDDKATETPSSVKSSTATKSKTVKTGDSLFQNQIYYLLLLCLSALLIICGVKRYKHKK